MALNIIIESIDMLDVLFCKLESGLEMYAQPTGDRAKRTDLWRWNRDFPLLNRERVNAVVETLTKALGSLKNI
jgi:hypothetical protein